MTERIELVCFKIGVLEQKRESSPLTNRVTEVATTPEDKPSMNTKIPIENGNIESSTPNHGENKWNTVDSSGFEKKKKRNQLADRNTQDTLEVRIVDDVDVNNTNSTNLNVQQKTLSAAIHEAEIAAKCNGIISLNAGVWNKTPKTHNISGRNKPIIGKMANCTTKAIKKSYSLHVQGMPATLRAYKTIFIAKKQASCSSITNCRALQKIIEYPGKSILVKFHQRQRRSHKEKSSCGFSGCRPLSLTIKVALNIPKELSITMFSLMKWLHCTSTDSGVVNTEERGSLKV
ncbi:hypothetical protein JTB14_020387 [Gonioctena quinquepunctata]|nr:hypothetical protein JTB14_020387 [Gonioctena quinquepunctata]